ncbi:Long-chain-fatty-acid--CoA ligase [bacterium HR10]|nr:Long-chain-fatty-acid--CoA ligase [bacterium HR10]
MIVRGPYPEIAIPEVPLTPFVLERAERWGEKAALIDGPTGRSVSYRALAESVRRVAAGLWRRGFRKGDVLALYSPNLPEYAVAFHAVSLIGGITATVNPLSTVEELTRQLRDAEAKYLLTVPSLLEKALEAARAAGVRDVFAIGAATGATPWTELFDDADRVPEVAISPREDVVVLPSSSGTTGLPKGVMLTHYNLVANICQVDAALHRVREEDVVIGVLPFFHSYGLLVVMNVMLYKGTTVVTMPRFELEPFLHILQAYGVTRAYLVPPIILALAKHPLVDRYDLSKLRVIMSGAAPLSEAVARACAERLGCLVLQGYGLTETSPVTHANPEDPARIKLASVGPPLPNTECQIVDPETGTPRGVNELGELWIRGPQVMKGYWKRPEETARTITPDGWLRTGDVGYVDEDGYFYIVDRIKELIKYKGLQIAPAELEAVLLSHPAVADAAVIPSPDEEAGEVPKAFIVRKADVSAEAVMAYVAERVAPYKKIRRVEFVDQIPRSASGKILRRVLIERERGGAA